MWIKLNRRRWKWREKCLTGFPKKTMESEVSWAITVIMAITLAWQLKLLHIQSPRQVSGGLLRQELFSSAGGAAASSSTLRHHYLCRFLFVKSTICTLNNELSLLYREKLTRVVAFRMLQVGLTRGTILGIFLGFG